MTTTQLSVSAYIHERLRKNSERTSCHNRNLQLQHVKDRCLELKNRTLKKHGFYSPNYMAACGFTYTGEGDSARCDKCNLTESDWASEKSPFKIHAAKSPTCPYILSLRPIQVQSPSMLTKPLSRSNLTSTEAENPSKRQKTEISDIESLQNILYETEALQKIRKRTFSHWPHRIIPSSAQMIEAGFFNCNVGDRVICIYCNLICQQWTPHTDDPCEVHKTLSSNCVYVKANLLRPSATAIVIVNENSTSSAAAGSQTSATSNSETLRSHEIVCTTPCNPAYAELPRRHASFATWPNENLPSVDDLVRAGFYYTNTETIVTCFYCNGSLQNWGPNDNPMIEHARWFPQCAYAKQLCGDDLYRKVQESKRAQQERARINEMREKANSNILTNNSAAAGGSSLKLLIPDESTLSRLVAARLDLPISQRLLNLNFKLSIIKRCWEDQLRLKHDDFVSESDLYIACMILQKQIEHIDGKKENIVIPSIKMKQIRERNAAPPQHEQPPTNTRSASSESQDVEMLSSTNESSSADSNTKTKPKSSDANAPKPKVSTSNASDQSDSSTSSNLCVLCWTEEKRLACIPCGHLSTCVPCGHSLRSCPVCRREIEAFVRVYI